MGGARKNHEDDGDTKMVWKSYIVSNNWAPTTTYMPLVVQQHARLKNMVVPMTYATWPCRFYFYVGVRLDGKTFSSKRMALVVDVGVEIYQFKSKS